MSYWIGPIPKTFKESNMTKYSRVLRQIAHISAAKKNAVIVNDTTLCKRPISTSSERLRECDEKFRIQKTFLWFSPKIKKTETARRSSYGFKQHKCMQEFSQGGRGRLFGFPRHAKTLIGIKIMKRPHPQIFFKARGQHNDPPWTPPWTPIMTVCYKCYRRPWVLDQEGLIRIVFN